MTPWALALVLLTPLLLGDGEAVPSWSPWTDSLSYPVCGKPGQTLEITPGRPPKQYSETTGVTIRDDEMPLRVPDPAEWCVDRRRTLSPSLSSWHFRSSARPGLTSASLVLRDHLLVPRLPEGEHIFADILRRHQLWPTDAEEAKRLAVLYFDLYVPCGDRIITSVSAFEERLRTCLGKLPFPDQWFSRAQSRLPRSLEPVSALLDAPLTVSFWASDAYGTISHVEVLFSTEQEFEVRRIVVVSPFVESPASPSN